MITFHIKSYVRRLGRMSDAQKVAMCDLWPKYGLEAGKELLNLDTVFKRTAPLVIEIGFGMGHALLAMAKQKPECNFIGIEVHKPGVASVLIELANQQITNVKLFCFDAIEILNHVIPDSSVQQINIYFPDPWQKRRHHKRRLIQQEFVELLHKKLITHGCIHLATDWQNYAEHMLKVMSNAQGFYNPAGDNQFTPRPESRPLTKFEERGHRLGHQVWDLVLYKK